MKPFSHSDPPAPPAVVTLLTPRGRSAVATIAYRGDLELIDAAGLFQAANGTALSEQPIDRVAFGRWGGGATEDVVVCRISPGRLEIHCHGGEIAAERILLHLEATGATRLAWRDFVAETEGPFAAEVADALSVAATPRTAAIIAAQANGPLRSALHRLAVMDIARDRDQAIRVLDSLLGWSVFGLHLTRPWRVVFFGPPNVGKSSLINALVGFERAIVLDRPGTTRDVVTAETAFDGWPVRLSDTAGLRTGTDELEAAGIARAKTELADADLRVLVLDRSEPTGGLHACDEFSPHLLVANKIDRPDAWRIRRPPDAIGVSAKTGEGIRELMAQIAAALVPVVPAADEAIPISPRQIDALRVARSAVESGDAAAFTGAMQALHV